MYILPQLNVKRLDYDQIGYKRLAIETSNHCKGKCWWCFVERNNYPPRPINEIIQKLNLFREDFDSIHFMDHDLATDFNRFKILSELLAVNSLQPIPKLGKTRVDSISPELINVAAMAGFKIISLGVESFDQTILDFLKKEISSKEIYNVLDTLLAHQIKPGINLILFSPLETVNSLNQTLGMALKYAQLGAYLNITNRLYVNFLTPLRTLQKFQNLIHFETVYFPGMSHPLRLPEFLIVENDDVRRIQELALTLQNTIEDQLRIQRDETRLSVPVKSLLFCSALSEILGRTDLIKLTREIIEVTLAKEQCGQIL